jgi:hypothetical protein
MKIQKNDISSHAGDGFGSVIFNTNTKPSSVNVECNCLTFIIYSSHSARHDFNPVRTHIQELRRNKENYLLHVYALDSHPKQLCDDYHLLFTFHMVFQIPYALMHRGYVETNKTIDYPIMLALTV